MIIVYLNSCLKIINKSTNKFKIRENRIYKKIKLKSYQNKTNNYKFKKVKKFKINKFNR
jgi:hypothetical protein